MAQIIVTIANTDLNRVIAGVCGFFNYATTIPQPVGSPLPNPETQTQFAKRMLVENVKAWVKTYEGQQAAVAAVTASNASADGLDIT